MLPGYSFENEIYSFSNESLPHKSRSFRIRIGIGLHIKIKLRLIKVIAKELILHAKSDWLKDLTTFFSLVNTDGTIMNVCWNETRSRFVLIKLAPKSFQRLVKP